MVAAMAGDQWSLLKVEQHRRRSGGAARCKRSKPAATIPFFDVTTGHCGPHRGKESSLIRPGSPAVTVLAVAAANATRTSVAKAEASRRKRCAQQGEPSRPPFLLCIAAHFFPHMTAWKSAAGLKTEGRPLANPAVGEEGDDRAREKPFRAAPQLWGACCWQGAICVRRRLYRREMAILRDSITQQNQNGLFAPTKKSVLLGARSIGASLWI